MLKPLNITKPNDFDDMYNIIFSFHKLKYGVYQAQNVAAFDTEFTTLFVTPDGDAIPFDQEAYDKAFDEEDPDTSFKDLIEKSEPISIMWSWQFAISSVDGNIYCFVGRTWEEYKRFLNKLTREAKRQAIYGFASKDRDLETYLANGTNRNKVKLNVYSHNLGIEFQGLRNVFEDYFTV